MFIDIDISYYTYIYQVILHTLSLFLLLSDKKAQTEPKIIIKNFEKKLVFC